MDKRWGKRALKDGNFIVLILYIDHPERGSDYISFQEENLLTQGAPHYAVINSQGLLVADENDIQAFGVQTASHTEEDRKRLFQDFLDKRNNKKGDAIVDW